MPATLPISDINFLYGVSIPTNGDPIEIFEIQGVVCTIFCQSAVTFFPTYMSKEVAIHMSFWFITPQYDLLSITDTFREFMNDIYAESAYSCLALPATRED